MTQPFTIIIDNDNIQAGELTLLREVRLSLKTDSMTELMLHPVRFRVIQCLLGDHHKTAQQISEELPDVPQATLYRHLNKLVDGGVLHIVDQNQVRGAVERVYALHAKDPDVNSEVMGMSRDQMRHTFMMFVASLVDDFDRYLKRDKIDLYADGVSYRKATVYLSDDEFNALLAQTRKLLEPTLQNEPAPGRKRRVIANVVMPDSNPSDGR